MYQETIYKHRTQIRPIPKLDLPHWSIPNWTLPQRAIWIDTKHIALHQLYFFLRVNKEINNSLETRKRHSPITEKSPTTAAYSNYSQADLESRLLQTKKHFNSKQKGTTEVKTNLYQFITLTTAECSLWIDTCTFLHLCQQLSNFCDADYYKIKHIWTASNYIPPTACSRGSFSVLICFTTPRG